MAAESQVQFAALLVPILGLLVVSAVDSVDKNDQGWRGWYPVFVFWLSIAALGPLAVASLLAIISVGIDVSTNTILIHSGIAVALSIMLIFGVTIRETMRDLDEAGGRRFLVGLGALAVYYAVLYFFGP